MSETRSYHDDSEVDGGRKEANPLDLRSGGFLAPYSGDSQFEFDAEGGPNGLDIKFYWADGVHCTWMRRLETPDWLSSRDLPRHEGLFRDQYGNMIEIIKDTVEITRRENPRNAGWTLRPPTANDI